MNISTIIPFFRQHTIKILVIFALAGGGYFYFQKNKTPSLQPQIKTEAVTRGDLVVSVTGSGQIAAKSQVNLKPVVAGDAIEVLQVAVKNDQGVKKGQIIAVLDTTDATKAVRDADFALQSAQIKQKQAKITNNNDSSIDQLARQTQKLSVNQQIAKLADAKEKLQDYYIRAPFDGVVTGLSVNPGDSISRDATLASVITKEMIAKISLNEVDAAQVRNGNQATLMIDALSAQPLSGTVSKIDTIGTVTQGVVYYNAEITLSDTSETLRPGMSVSAAITIAKKENTLIIPNGAVKNSDRNGLYVQVPAEKNAPAKIPGKGGLNLGRKSIEVGIANDTETEVTSGLNEGDIIVTQITTGGAGAAARSGGLLNSLTSRRGTGGGNR